MKTEKDSTLKRKTVLLIDDEPEWLSVISDALQQQPFRLVTASSGESALEKLKKLHPDLILSDVRMPIMNGFDLYERIRSNPKLKGIPYVFMSSIDDFDAIHFAKQLGADDYVTKPFDTEGARTVVLDLLNRFSK